MKSLGHEGPGRKWLAIYVALSLSENGQVAASKYTRLKERRPRLLRVCDLNLA